MRSMPSSTVRLKRSSPSPRSTVSLPLRPVMTSASGPPSSVSAASEPSMTSVPAPPSRVSAIRSPVVRSAVMKSTSPRPKTVRRSSAGRAFSIRMTGSRPSTRTVSRNGRTPMLLKPSVPWTWIWSRAPSSRPRSASTSSTAESVEVADVDQVLPARRVDVERLDGGAVGRRGAGVACDPRLALEGLQRELLRVGRSGGEQPVLAALAVDAVEPVALERGVVACAEDDGVVAAAGLPPGRRRRRSRSARRPGPPITVSAPAPVAIVVGSVSASAIWTVSLPAPERMSICVNVARLKSQPLTSTVVGEVRRSVMRVGRAVADDGQRAGVDGGEDRGLGGGRERDGEDRGEEQDSAHAGHPARRAGAPDMGAVP